MVTVSLKGSYTVKPAQSTPNHTLWLSEIDQAKAWTHSPTVYFYKPTSHPNFFSPETVRSSLSQALVQFYPLTGRLEPDDEGRLQLNCNEKGVQFVEAESDSVIDDFDDFKPTPDLRKLAPFVDYNTHISEWPLLLVQLTFFPCGGVCLGMATSHTVVDGAAAMLFISAWAMIARGERCSTLVPSFDRTVLRARSSSSHPQPTPLFDHIEYKTPPTLVDRHEDDTEVRMKETTVVTLNLNRDQVELLKGMANEGRPYDERDYTRYESLAGHLWKCATKARGLVSEQVTKVHVSVDCRHRLNPSLPAAFFGNATFPATPLASAGDLISRPLSYAASRIREALKRMDNVYVRSAIDFLGSQRDWTPFRTSFHTINVSHGAYYGCPNLAITSWMGLPLYNANFGWGEPFHMGPTSLGDDGKCYIISARQGDGSIVIYMRLHTEYIHTFTELFYEGLEIEKGSGVAMVQSHGQSWSGSGDLDRDWSLPIQPPIPILSSLGVAAATHDG